MKSQEYKSKYVPIALLGIIAVLIYLYRAGKQDALDDIYLTAIRHK